MKRPQILCVAKVALGIACLLMALSLPLGLTYGIATDFKFGQLFLGLPDFLSLFAPFALCAISLVVSGVYLILKRHLSFTKTANVLVAVGILVPISAMSLSYYRATRALSTEEHHLRKIDALITEWKNETNSPTVSSKGQSVTNTDNGDAAHTPKDHMPRAYFKQADYSAFDGIQLGMTRDKVRQLCGGQPYPQIETTRGNFAFSVDTYPSGILALPISVPLNQEIDFFVGKELKKVLVVFYKDLKADRVLIFDFAKMKWEQRPNPALEPKATAP